MMRSSQRDILPTAIKNRGLGHVVNVTDNAEASTSLANGEDALVSLILNNNKDADIIGEPEFSLWQDSISAANLLPIGSGIVASEYQIIGPWNEWTEVLLLGGEIDLAIPTLAMVSRLYVRNISAGAITLIVRARMRFITNTNDVSLT